MLFDFNTVKPAENQQRDNRIIPAGSKVRVKCSLFRPYGATTSEPWVDAPEGRMARLRLNMAVKGGAFDGVSFSQSFALPQSMQKSALTIGQKRACDISAMELRAILSAGRGVPVCDETERAKLARRVDDWSAFDMLEFWAVIKHSKNTDRVFMEIGRVIDHGSDEHKTLESSGEVIATTPVTTSAPVKPPTPTHFCNMATNDEIPF